MKNKQIKKQFISSMLTRDMILELLDKVSTYLKMADLALEQRDLETVNHCLVDSENILLELQSILRDEDPQTRMAYDFINLLAEELFYINLNKDRARLREAIQVVGRLVAIYSNKVGK